MRTSFPICPEALTPQRCGARPPNPPAHLHRLTGFACKFKNYFSFLQIIGEKIEFFPFYMNFIDSLPESLRFLPPPPSFGGNIL